MVWREKFSTALGRWYSKKYLILDKIGNFCEFLKWQVCRETKKGLRTTSQKSCEIFNFP